MINLYIEAYYIIDALNALANRKEKFSSFIALETINYQNMEIKRWDVGPSTFLLLPEKRARLLNWHVNMGRWLCKGCNSLARIYRD